MSRLTPISPRKLDHERNRRALSVSALAERAGVSESRLSRILSAQDPDHVMVRSETASRLAAALAEATVRTDLDAILPDREGAA